MLCRIPWWSVHRLCILERVSVSFPLLCLASSLMGFTVRTKIPGESSRNSGQQGRSGGCPGCEYEAILTLKVLMESFALRSSTTRPCGWVRCQNPSSWEWKSLKPGNKSLDFRSYAICYKWLSKTKFSIPNWALKIKIEPCREHHAFHCKREYTGNEPFLKNSVMESGKVTVQGDWRIVWELENSGYHHCLTLATPWWSTILQLQIILWF